MSNYSIPALYAPSARIYKEAKAARPELEKALEMAKGRARTNKTEIPSHLTGDIQTPKNASEVRNMQKALVQNLKALRMALIDQIPKIPLDMSSQVGGANVECDEKQNNYILHLDLHPNLEHDQENNKLILRGDDGEVAFEIDLSKSYSPLVDGKIVVGEPLMCDQGAFSQETFGGHVRMASFNDGNGWTNASMRAAKMANETALKSMEEGMKA